MDRDDSHLYHANGTPYWDGDIVDKQGLYRADGVPANYQDFVQRYWTEPPEEWAKQFPEYEGYTPPPIRIIDIQQLAAEKLIKTRGTRHSPEIEQSIREIGQLLEPARSTLLDELEVSYYGLPTLNGYAYRTLSGKRGIVLHAGLMEILSHLGKFMGWILKTNKSAMVYDCEDVKLTAKVVALAEYICSGADQGRTSELFEALPEKFEFGSALLAQIWAEPIRDAQVRWIVAHECAHHFLGHIEILEDDLKRCHGHPDCKHYQLRRQLELEADRDASELIVKLSEKNRQFNLYAVYLLLTFLCFTDAISPIDYENSTHPPAIHRLVAFRRNVTERSIDITGPVDYFEQGLSMSEDGNLNWGWKKREEYAAASIWEKYLDACVASHQYPHKSQMKLQFPPGLGL
jgi:hypothetical protein